MHRHSTTFAACCVGVQEWQTASAHVPGRQANSHSEESRGAITMLYTIAVILLIAWVLGLVGTYTIGAFVHMLLVAAVVLFLVGLLSGRRTTG